MACMVVTLKVRSSVQGRARLKIRAGLEKERTLNMRYIVLTLDVLRVSGWLKDDAPCVVPAGRGGDHGLE